MAKRLAVIFMVLAALFLLMGQAVHQGTMSGDGIVALISGLTIDISENTNLVVSGSPGSLIGDTVTLKEAQPLDVAFTNPVTGHSAVQQWRVRGAITTTTVSCRTTGASSTATIQLDERAFTTGDSAGTDVMTAQLVCDENGQETSSFTNAGIAAGALLSLDIDDVANAPTALRVWIEYDYQ